MLYFSRTVAVLVNVTSKLLLFTEIAHYFLKKSYKNTHKRLGIYKKMLPMEAIRYGLNLTFVNHIYIITIFEVRELICF